MSATEDLVIGRIHTVEEIKKTIRPDDPVLKILMEEYQMPKKEAIQELAEFLQALEAGLRTKEVAEKPRSTHKVRSKRV
jgi:hypothetical protein